MQLSPPAYLTVLLLAAGYITPGSSDTYRMKRQLDQGLYPTYAAVPRTSFSCDERGPGYYADMDTGCQVFHICHHNRASSFLCPNGTIFNQEVFVCDWWYNVDCGLSEQFFSLNSRIGVVPESSQRSRGTDTQVNQGSSQVAQTRASTEVNRGSSQVARTGSRSIQVNQGSSRVAETGVSTKVSQGSSRVAQTGAGLTQVNQRSPAVSNTEDRTFQVITSDRSPGLIATGQETPQALEGPLFGEKLPDTDGIVSAGDSSFQVSTGREQDTEVSGSTLDVSDSTSGQREFQNTGVRLASQSQATVRTARPEVLRGTSRQGKRLRVESGRGGGQQVNLLIPNTLLVEVPKFRVTGIPGPTAAPATGRQPYSGFSTTERRAYLPEAPTTERSSSTPTTGRRGYLPEAAPSGFSSTDQREYLPTSAPLAGPAGSSGFSTDDRREYLPTGGFPSASSGFSSDEARNYLPGEEALGPNRLDGPRLNLLDGPVFTLPAPPAPSGGGQRQDDYGLVSETTRKPFLPPMNLLPLSNEVSPPSSQDKQLPSTTESYGILPTEGPAAPIAPPLVTRRPVTKPQVKPRPTPAPGRRTSPRPSSAPSPSPRPTPSPTSQPPPPPSPSPQQPPEFRYDFDRVRQRIPQLLAGVEPLDVPAAVMRRKEAKVQAQARQLQTTAPGGRVPSAPWLYSLSEVPMWAVTPNNK